jgi:hypothetical protein
MFSEEVDVDGVDDADKNVAGVVTFTDDEAWTWLFDVEGTGGWWLGVGGNDDDAFGCEEDLEIGGATELCPDWLFWLSPLTICIIFWIMFPNILLFVKSTPSGWTEENIIEPCPRQLSERN